MTDAIGNLETLNIGNLPVEIQRRAALTVCHNARSVDEATDLLTMLAPALPDIVIVEEIPPAPQDVRWKKPTEYIGRPRVPAEKAAEQAVRAHEVEGRIFTADDVHESIPRMHRPALSTIKRHIERAVTDRRLDALGNGEYRCAWKT